MSDRTYNVLKWVSMICIPAVVTFLTTVLPAVGVEASVSNVVITVVGAVGTLLGTLIGISTYQYNKHIED